MTPHRYTEPQTEHHAAVLHLDESDKDAFRHFQFAFLPFDGAVVIHPEQYKVVGTLVGTYQIVPIRCEVEVPRPVPVPVVLFYRDRSDGSLNCNALKMTYSSPIRH